MKDIIVLIATHREYDMPKDGMYVPVRVGSALANDDYGYTRDDTGENISTKNPNFCELTALYWGWKNVKADYVGLAHYRRHFSVRGGKNKNARILTEVQAQKLCEKYDVILPKRRRYFIETLYSHYEHTHDAAHLDTTRDIIAVQSPEYLDVYDKVMKRTWAHVFNMCIMRKDLLDAYCSWLYPILFELEKRVDVSTLSSFDARLFGRVSELLLDVWIEQNKLKYKEIGFVQMGSENWGKKICGFLAAKFLGKKYSQSK